MHRRCFLWQRLDPVVHLREPLSKQALGENDELAETYIQDYFEGVPTNAFCLPRSHSLSIAFHLFYKDTPYKNLLKPASWFSLRSASMQPHTLASSHTCPHWTSLQVVKYWERIHLVGSACLAEPRPLQRTLVGSANPFVCAFCTLNPSHGHRLRRCPGSSEIQ